jgi:2-amino-4-hydroxy-6-hydroxymethyldihydropteridine diphosphokinase
VSASGAPRTRVAVALGSNLGDRTAHLAWAVDALATVLSDLRVSPLLNTAPVDVPDDQPDYLNAVVVGRTTLPPRALLDQLLAFEAARGRVRPGLRSARTLDLDLVLYGTRVIDEPGLQVPHPRFRERDFVLGPLAALAPRWRDPVSGQTLAALWRTRRLPGRG